MYSFHIKGKTIKVADRSVIARLKSTLPILGIDDTRDRIIKYANNHQTELADAYRKLIKLGII